MATAILNEHRSLAEPDQFAAEPRSRQPKTLGPLVVAVDGTVRSDAAIRAAKAIASVTHQRVLVFTVHVPLPVLGPEVGLAASPTMEADRRKDQFLQVLEQLERVGVTEAWPVKVTTGFPAATIAKFAKNVNAALIVMGLGGHGVIDRIFGDEMVLQVLRVGTVPVLAIADTFDGLPRRAVAAVDFSASSKRALELCGPVLQAGDSQVSLAHVVVTGHDPVDWRAVDSPRVGSISRALDQFATEADLPDVVVREQRVLTGDPATRLLEVAKETRADLIVTGSHGHNFLSRLLLGSVSTKLLRKAGCSILIAPPIEEPALDEELPEVRERFAFFDWAERLEDFTRRHLWRHARLEVFDPEIGAQVMQDGTTFMGASFDPRESRVQLMFSLGTDLTQHHTHVIDGVTGIQILRDRGHAESYLRIGHGRGQTLLTLER